ncbi:MAG: APC family permease [Acidobacteriia bacterium]|nr:APC family permease [Terriglobia bacterium]
MARSQVRKASLFYFVFVMYSYTTAGPFGLEGVVAASGPGMALIYDLVLPFFWCIPMSLVSAELTTAMPVEGGFYRWVRAAFGDFWGFLAGWWNWMAAFLLASAYAVLFADYLGFYFPQLTGWKHTLLAIALIWVMAYINLRGIQAVGLVATVLEIAVLIPVVALCAASLPQWRHNPFVPLVPPHRPTFEIFGVGLALGLWGYSGYEQLSTVAEEVENPQRSYPRALAWVVPLSMLTYFLPTFCSLAALGNWGQWNTRYFVDAAQAIGGLGLGIAMTLSAAISSVAALNSTILTTTRIPFVMAQDGYLPGWLTRLHPRYGTPWMAIGLSAIIYSLFAIQTLTQLISLYIWLRIATSVMTFLAAWQLRRKMPGLPRPFRVPGGRKGLIYAVGAPLVASAVALVGSDRFGALWGPVALALGPAAYLLMRRAR